MLNLKPHALHHISLSSYTTPLYVRSRGTGVGDPKEQVREVWGQQATRCEDTNIVVMKVSPGASHHHP
jgi:hypothetical protein